jgi:hypothetical protein
VKQNWRIKDADPDNHILKHAKTEYDAIERGDINLVLDVLYLDRRITRSVRCALGSPHVANETPLDQAGPRRLIFSVS